MQVRLMILLVKLRGGGRTFKKFDISTIILVFTMLIEYKFVKTANLTLYAWYWDKRIKMKRYLLHIILLNHKALKNCSMCMVLRLKIIYIFQVSCSVLGVGELLATLSKVLRSMTLAEIAGFRSVKWTPGGAMLEFAVLEVSVNLGMFGGQ